ncbi:PDF receptor-like [Physella acuta]|uniref:PDF receptor-like n=1 Tax=Physella acuta TaxID=109671 RepID=UPI0027DE6A4C|nr:PDF receptor-like [Physella acuta]
MQKFYGFKNAQACLTKLGDWAKRTDGPYCPGVWDTILCWPAAKAGTKVYLPCPPMPGLVPENKAWKNCGPEGQWETKEKGVYTNGTGYTYYRDCYSREAWEAYVKYLSNKTVQEKEMIKEIINNSRTLEIVGLCISVVTAIISLVIFCYFSTLKCHRTRIHKNLFVAMIVQISMRIILYVDQLVARETGGKIAGAASGDSNTIYDTPIFCEVLYSLLEYTKTVKFMWMFIEGIYLHNMIAVSVFSGKPNYIVFYSIGWGFPMLLTIAWVIPMSQIYETRCWFGYYMNPLIWIIEGPRAAVMAVNLFFLLNIIRVLVMKLRESQTNEANKLRKAVKAAIVLLPLLGLTNFVVMLEPDGADAVKFSVYSFSSSFLNASEGFFISLLYCFLNGEVRQALKRQCYRWRQHRLIHSSSLRRMSRSLSIFTSFTEVPHTTTSQKSQPSAVASNGDVSEISEGTQSRFSAIFKGRTSRRQSSRDMGSGAGPKLTSDAPDLPDIVTCRTDLMCEEKV